jgi:chromosome segregation ATPase
MTKVKENRGGSRVANPDYKKVRRDVFSMVEQLVESNTILTQSLQHNEKLQTKCLARIKDMRAKIDDLEKQINEYDGTEFILRDKIEQQNHRIEHQDQLIQEYSDDVIREAGDKAFKSNSKRREN